MKEKEFYTCKNNRAFKEVFMKEDGLTSETISKYTSLTIEEINEL